MATPAEIVREARTQLSQLTGLEPDTVSSLSKTEEGWSVEVEMVELKHVPNSRDVLATYQVILDDEGNVQRYQRTRRYRRDKVTEE